MNFWEKVGNFFGWVKVRARDEDGRYVADDKSTKKNEAYKMVHKDLVKDGRYVADDKSTKKNEAYKMVHKDLVKKPKRKYTKRKKK
jgi:hypothetical protein